MELINPDGSKLKVDAEAAKKPEDAEKPKEEAPATFKADFNTPGWMKLEINLDAVSYSRQAQWQLMGFMDDHKAIAMNIIGKLVMQRNQVNAVLQKQQSKNGMHRFLDKLRK